MNPPPPMLPASGSTTVSANPTPAAASMAFPPCLMISIPTSLASGWPDTTIALRPDTATALPASDQASGMIGRPVTTASARAPRAVGWTAVAAGAAGGAPGAAGGGWWGGHPPHEAGGARVVWGWEMRGRTLLLGVAVDVSLAQLLTH